MENKLINHFSKFTRLTTDEIKNLTESMVVKQFKAGSFLANEGKANQDTYFVLQGLVRQYTTVDGSEITTNFYAEENWIISLTSFSQGTSASESLVCIEDTTVVVGNEPKAQEVFKQFPRLETVSRAIMEDVFSQQQKLTRSYLTDTPEQRYLKLLKTKPDILQRVPQYQIASYIGVKPESLSRIRKRISQNS